jgi:peptide/nickel transport system permease protein
MISRYLIRRLLYAIPVLIGVNLITFLLFFGMNTPDDMARSHLGRKHVTQAAIERWKHSHGYDKPLFYNAKATGTQKFIETLFVTKSLHLFAFKFGSSDAGRNIGHDIGQRMWPSLALAVPVLLVGVLVNITFALIMVLFRGTGIDTFSVFFCVILMSISALFYIITGQFLVAKLLHLTPISGYDYGWSAIKFLILPVAIGVVGGIGVGSRWYRSLFLEEVGKDYVVTARAKGCSEWQVLYRHVLPNALIPIVTGVVVIIPSLFLGSLLMESFFGIPGLGSYMIDAISQQDYAIVRVMVFVGSVFYIIGLILTDITYTIVDPRIRLQ